jgi:hypothetical protein
MGNRLQSELWRLYGLPPEAAQPHGGEVGGVCPPMGSEMARCLVLGVGQPAQWDAVYSVWVAVQSELEMPAPAIAVDGSDGFQLWFSLAQGVPIAQAQRFLDLLSAACLERLKPTQVRCWTPLETARDHADSVLWAVPGKHPVSGQWSAFVAPDLARIFESEPWLPSEPGADAQADVLSNLQPTSPQRFQGALDALVARLASDAPKRRDEVNGAVGRHLAGKVPADGPYAFLLAVMNDPTVDMLVRVEAAKALLPYSPHN